MKSLSSWLLAMFMIMFWVFRIAVTLSAQYGSDFGGFIVFNNTIEIVLLFLSLVCFIFIVRRIIWGAIVYLVAYGWYFGGYIFSNMIPALTSGEAVDMSVLENSFVAIIGLIIALCTVIDIAYEKTKLKHFSDNKTDWYFKNDKYDREMDERADKNQYRTL